MSTPVIIEVPNPVTRVVHENFEWAIVFNDYSGAVAIFCYEDDAKAALEALEDRRLDNKGSGLGAYKLVRCNR